MQPYMQSPQKQVAQKATIAHMRAANLSHQKVFKIGSRNILTILYELLNIYTSQGYDSCTL